MQAAERRSPTAAAVQAAADPIEDWSAEQDVVRRAVVQPGRPQPNISRPGSGVRVPRHRGRRAVPLAQPRLPVATGAVGRPAVEGVVWREQLPSRLVAPVPTSLCPPHWRGTLANADDFVSAVNAAGSGDHVMCGVCSELPPGTTGLAAPRDVTATLVLMGGRHCPLATTALRAPARDVRGQTRLSKLHFLRIWLELLALGLEACQCGRMHSARSHGLSARCGLRAVPAAAGVDALQGQSQAVLADADTADTRFGP